MKREIKTQTGRVITFDKLRQNKPTIEVIPKRTIKRIFNHYENNLNNQVDLRSYIMFRLLLETGVRIYELLNIKVEDIHKELLTIHVKITKTKEERFVLISKTTMGYIEIYIYKYLIKGHLLQNLSGNKLSYRAVDKLISRLKRKLRINRSISHHKWRHTFANNYIANGGDTASLQRLLGHRNLSTTEKYLHLKFDLLRKRYYEIMDNSYSSVKC